MIAELNMPRFMASGDTSRLTLDITDLTHNRKNSRCPTASGLLELVSDSPAAVELAPGVRLRCYPGASIAGLWRWRNSGDH
ncbi:hypothetical protein ACLK19_16705 [Escherichia coli]